LCSHIRPSSHGGLQELSQLAFRNRLFEFLVQEMGFTAIAAETGYSESVAADDYVLGRKVERHKAATAAFSWARWPSEENAQLLDWMNAQNVRSGTNRPLRFYGLDLSGGRNGTFTEARLAVDAALQYLRMVDREREEQLRHAFDPLLDRFNTAGYPSLTQQQRDALSGPLADVFATFERDHIRFVRASSAAEYHGAYQYAVVARQLDMNFRAQTRFDVQPLRDSSMARNLLWVLEREGPKGLPTEGHLADWLAEGKPSWNYRFNGNPAKSFDAVVVIDTISPLRPLR
jgi:erythromycin esterase